MAEYGVQATTLSAPQGAGANVVNPVSPAPAGESFLASPIVSSIVDVFSKGLIQTRKEDAEKRKNTIVQGYIRQETTLNDAVASGQMTPAQSAARSRANFNQYAAGYGEYIEDFEKAGKALRGFSEKGESERQVETEVKRREADISQAAQRGFQFIAGMSPQAEDAQIKAAKTGIQAEAQMSEMYKANDEKRAQGTFDAGVAAKEEKDMGFRLVNEIAGSNLTAFQEFAKTLGDQVRGGKMSEEAAQISLASRFNNIGGALQAAARTNPELAAPYRSLFEDINTIGQKLINKTEHVDKLKAELEEKIIKMKLIALGNPETAAIYVANQIMPGTLALQSRVEATKMLAVLSSKPVTDKTYTPQVVGNPEVEPDTLKLLKGGLTMLKSGKVSNKEIATVQASNSVNHILKQTGEMINRGAEPAQLKGVAEFFASPEYAGFVTNGTIDKEAAGTAYKTFQMLYEPAIMNGVQSRLDQTLDRAPIMRGGASKTGVTDRIKVAEAIDIKFTGSGIVFEAKSGKNMQPAEITSQRQMLDGLRSAQQGVNQLIHIAAHMEGSTDYNKFWESNKHKWMPSIFPDPVRLKPGSVVDGFTYTGGAYGDRNNWKPVSETK